MRTDQKLFCLKTTLTIFLCILWLIGAAIFGVLLWLRLDFWTNEYLELDKNESLKRYLILLYLTLAAGAVIVAFSIFGLIGGCLKKKWLLVVYLIALVAAMGLTISAFTYGAIYRDELERSLVKDELLKTLITTKYTGIQTDRINRAVNIMQSELECCGANDPVDYKQSVWCNVQQSSDQGCSRPYKVPGSCCKNYLRLQQASCPLYISQSESNDPTSGRKSEDIWPTGCQIKLQEFFDRYIIVVISITVVYFVLQLICTAIASFLVHMLNTLYVPQPDDIVYDMAHMQEKSPYPSRGDYRDYYN
uniref:Tetraspanin n=1 Tax=Biomphalaria glabrata TaxID=6526 RepID=A0A2C9LEL6_BIOGL